MVLHLTSATHYIASCRVIYTIAGTTSYIHSLKNMNILSRHLCVSYKETCSSE